MKTTSFVFVEAKMWYPETVSLLNVREQFCERLTVTVFWRVTRELIDNGIHRTFFLLAGHVLLRECGM